MAQGMELPCCNWISCQRSWGFPRININYHKTDLKSNLLNVNIWYTLMMKKSISLVLLLSIIPSTLTTVTAAAAKPVNSGSVSTPLGIDISWPQCGKRLPTDQAFGIVGVNGGLANTTNPCLKDQLIWASKSVGGTVQEKIQLYVNTANPGGLNTVSWPKDNIDRSGNIAPNPHGICDGSDSLACAWQYGWNRAVEDVVDRFQPAAVPAGINSSPSAYVWWLDVETENTWKTPDTTFNTQSNVAVLEGMTEHFKSIGGRVGLYSTAYQWGQIVGTSVGSTSNLNGLNTWRAGSLNLNSAKEACTTAPLTVNGKVALTQFVSKGLDYNYSCI